ncbi:MAG TPA: pyrimidine dimer DNA glycosylase/endonuclease V [Patescibacteria group bacterium]|nr:MAG: hypothetical protein UR43_C0005G0112 [candidate division TM6 bacterium GW2011_GWF2_33_332]HLD91056.1 pyrimidine dimer DNA glycosylase/endonuclease V [Patescibacteria group bacterium]
MQIFATYNCPIKSAKYLDNKRVIKQVLESAQLLSNAIHLNNGVGPYKLTHRHHPLTISVKSSRSNYKWLLEHFYALCKEYTRRFNKVHKCRYLSTYFETNVNLIPDNELYFVNCTDFKDIQDVHLAYRICLRKKWKNDIIKPRWRKK